MKLAIGFYAPMASDDEIDYVRLVYEWDESYGNEPFFKYSDSGYDSMIYFPRENTIYQKIPECLMEIQEIIGEEYLKELTTKNPELALASISLNEATFDGGNFLSSGVSKSSLGTDGKSLAPALSIVGFE